MFPKHRSFSSVAIPLIGIFSVAAIIAFADSSRVESQSYRPWLADDGTSVSGVTLMCATGEGRKTAPCGNKAAPLPTLGLPFQRDQSGPFIFEATPTPRQYVFSQPLGTMSYRAVNPCANAQIRVMSVKATEPLVATPTIYPGVRLVTSETEVVTPTTGTRFLQSYTETLSSVPNPMAGPQRVVSIMTVPIPGSDEDISNLVCPFEIGYGNGG